MKNRQFFKVLSLGVMISMAALLETGCMVRVKPKRIVEKFGIVTTIPEYVSLTNTNSLKSSTSETTTTARYLLNQANSIKPVYVEPNLRTADTVTNDITEQLEQLQENSQNIQQETTKQIDNTIETTITQIDNTIETTTTQIDNAIETTITQMDSTIETNIDQESNISSIVMELTRTLTQPATTAITDIIREDLTNATTKIITEIATQDTTETTTKIITNEIIQNSTKEDSDQVYNMYGKPVDKDNCLILNGNYIQITYGPATSSNVDQYDVVQDTELWSNEKNKYLFGHSVGSFIRLSKNKVGDEIILINNGVAKKYETIRSERGHLTKDNTEIESYVDGCNLIHSDFGCETIRLITCHGWDKDGRWVVIARRIE